MNDYELTLRKEVMTEKAAGILGDLFRYAQENQIEDNTNPVNIMFSLLWNAKEDIISATSGVELDRIDGKLDIALSFTTDIVERKVS